MSVISGLNNNEKLALYRRIAKELNISGNGYDEFIKKNHIDGTKISSIYLKSFSSLELGGILSYIFRNDKSKLDVSKFEKQDWLKQYGNDLSLLLELFIGLEFTDKNKKNIRNLKIRCEEVLRLVKAKTIYTVSEICDNLSNPLDNDEFMKKVLGELLKSETVEVRKIWISNDKRPDNSRVIDNKIVALRLVKYVIRTLISILENKKYHLLSVKLKTILEKDNNYVEVLEKLKKLNENDFQKLAECLIEPLKFQIISTKLGYNNVLKSVLGLMVDDFDLKGGHGDRQGDNVFEKGYDKYNARIYINPSLVYYPSFIELYIQKCMKAGIGFVFKFQNLNAMGNKDNLILYLSIEQLPTVIKILNEIEYEHPEWINTFGTVPSNTGILGSSYYGICHGGAVDYDKKSNTIKNIISTYNDYCMEVFIFAFYSLIAGIALDRNFVSDINDIKIMKKIAKEIEVPYNHFEFDNSIDIEYRKNLFSNSLRKCKLTNGLYDGGIMNDMANIIEKYDLLNKINRLYPNLLNNSDVLKLFKVKCQNISDGLEERLGRKKGNICVSKLMDDYCEIERQQLRERREGMSGRKR